MGGAGRPITLAVKLDWGARVTALVSVATVLLLGLTMHQTQNANRKQEQLTIQGQVSQRFSSAIDQLGQEGDDKLSIRLGGIYSLERLMRDSPGDEPTVIEVLCAFLRIHAIRPDRMPESVPPSPPDVRAAVVALARRPRPELPEHRQLDLAGTLLGLPNVDLRRANLRGAVLRDAVLTGADLRDADLSGADLSGAALGDAMLRGAVLGGAVLIGADLRAAFLTDADLRGANLTGADLRRASLGSADLGSAILRDAYLGGADLRFVDLRAVRGLTSQQMAGTNLNLSTRLPPGVVKPALEPMR